MQLKQTTGSRLVEALLKSYEGKVDFATFGSAHGAARTDYKLEKSILSRRLIPSSGPLRAKEKFNLSRNSSNSSGFMLKPPAK